MVVTQGREYLLVVSSLEDEYSGGKEKRVYCKKNDPLFVTMDSGNVQIVFGKYGYFPILTSKIKEIMVSSPEELIEKIKTVDSRMTYGFPTDFVLGILETKEWKEEFVDKLTKSDVRKSLKEDILKRL
jgi:hypothetical protein